MNRPLIIAAALAAFLLLAGCSEGDARQKDAKGGAKSDAKDAPPAVAVTAVDVALREVPVAFESVGRAEGSREVQVRARVTGILERQMYNEGDAVKAGAPLFRIERAPFEIELAQARGLLAQETSRNALAKQELERLKGLADRRAISQKEADQAEAAAQQSVATVQIAEARVKQAELNLSYTSVDAPIGGITGRAMQSIGSLVAPNNESAMLTTLTRADPLWVRFALSETEFARLRSYERNVKDAIEVKLESADGTAYPTSGKINFSGSTVDPATGTVQMRAEVANPKLQLLPGQYLKVRVVAGTQQAIVVPQTAVAQNQAGRFVWLAIGGKAAQRQIRAGDWLGGDWVVLEGLKPGDTVILDNLGRLRPGAPVQIKKG
jgi:membrane fusion protein (multidrug efflux system)